MRYIVVDDEYYARQRTKRCINWQAQGFTFAGEAENAASALALLRETGAELAVVDITMVGESGLDFIRKARLQSPGTVFIVLSGYSKFEYAQEAMQYGVESYLTKPVNEAEMLAAVARARERLGKRAQRENAPYWRGFFYSASTGRPADPGPMLAAHGIQPGETYALTMCDFCVGDGPGYPKPAAIRTLEEDALMGRLAAEVVAVLTTDAFGHLILLVHDDGAKPLEQALARAAEEITQKQGAAYYIGLSSPCSGTAEGLLQAYRQAEAAYLSKIFYPGQGRMIPYKQGGASIKPFAPYNRRIQAALQGHNEQALEKELGALFEALQGASMEALEAQLTQLLALAKQQAGQPDKLASAQHAVLMSCRDLIANMDSLDGLRIEFTRLLLPFARPAEKQKDSGARLVQQAQELMALYYNRYGFGLERLAARLMLSPAYLSSVFKKQTGQTVVQHLTRLRMEEARRLLAESHTVQEVADSVGYNDMSYFSKCFKKYFGVSPSSFKNGEEQNGDG